MFIPAFLRNMLPSSSGSLDLFGVNAELILARKFVHDVGKFQTIT
jgi:hypothetical protein